MRPIPSAFTEFTSASSASATFSRRRSALDATGAPSAAVRGVPSPEGAPSSPGVAPEAAGARVDRTPRSAPARPGPRSPKRAIIQVVSSAAATFSTNSGW